jgi:hypothetical protein
VASALSCFSAASIGLLVLASCTPDPCLERWLAWRNGLAPYGEVCKIDRNIDNYYGRTYRR